MAQPHAASETPARGRRSSRSSIPPACLIAANDRANGGRLFAPHVKVGGSSKLRADNGPEGEAWSYALAPLVGDDVFIAFAMRDLDLFSWTYFRVAADLLASGPDAGACLDGDLDRHRPAGDALDRLSRRMAMAYARGHYAIRPAALEDAPSEFRELGETFQCHGGGGTGPRPRLRDAVAQKTMLIRKPTTG